MSAMSGSPTSTGWKRRSRAASFSMCLRYSSSVVAPTARSSPRASIGFSRLAASTAPSAAPAPTIVWSSSMKRTIRPSPAWTSLEHGLEPLLELAAVLRAGEQGADVERDHAAVAQRLGHVAGDDALGEALDDRGLADAGVADQDRVVLGPPREHLDHAADLLVAADHRVELARLGLGRQVAAELLERLGRVLGVGRVGHVRPDDSRDRLQQRVAVGEEVGDAGLVPGQREQEVLGRDRLASLRRRLALGGLERRDEGARGPRLGRLGAADVGQLRDERLRPLARAPRRRRRSAGGPAPEKPSACPSSASSRCAGVASGLPDATADCCAAATASWLLIVNRSGCIAGHSSIKSKSYTTKIHAVSAATETVAALPGWENPRVASPKIASNVIAALASLPIVRAAGVRAGAAR